ncbi:MAG: arcadin 1 [Thermoplasmata archaeon]
MLSKKVTVINISSYYDQESRTRGREIDLDEYIPEKDHQVQSFALGPEFINDLMKGITQTVGFQSRPNQKLILRLTDEEYESLGIKFEVNDIYSLTFEEGRIEFKRDSI